MCVPARKRGPSSDPHPKSCSGPCVYAFNGDRVFVDVLGTMRSPGSGWFAESTDPDKKRVLNLSTMCKHIDTERM